MKFFSSQMKPTIRFTTYCIGGIVHLRPIPAQWGIPDEVRQWVIALVVGVGMGLALSVFAWIVGG